LPGATVVGEFHHPNEEVWIVIAGELEVTIGGATEKVGPGSVAIVPPNAAHSVRALTGGRAIAANHPVRHDMR
jgi:quercetin dioxygenase-like cupin family protein